MRFRCGRLVSAFLLAASAVRALEFQIGPDVALDSVALAAGRQEYLVVWRDISAAPRMYGALVTNLGVVSAEFPISNPESVPLESPVQRTTVAFNSGSSPGVGDSFLVVWADTRAGGAGIRGALLTPQGSVLGGGDFPIASFVGQPILTDTSGTAVAQPYAPQVAFTGNGWLIAWQDAPLSSAASGSQVRYARVDGAGVAGPAQSLPAGSGTVAQLLDFVVRGPLELGEGLLVIQDASASPVVTRATRIALDNSITGPQDGAFLFSKDFSVTGFGLSIGAAFDAATNEYAILSSYSAQIDSSVFKTRLLLPGGTVIRPSAPLAEVVQGTTGLAEDEFPRACYNASDEFLFVRNDKVSDTAFHLITQRVTLAGKNRDPNPVIVDSASQGVLNGGQAAAIGTQYLLVWMDGRRSGAQPERQLNVFGLLIDGSKPGDESAPLIKAVARAAPILGNSPLLVTFNGGGAGIIDTVRWDFGDGTSASSFAPAHTYQNKGEFIAVLSLNRAGYAARDFVRISVDSEVLGSAGGPPQSVGGSVGPVSNGVNTDIFSYNFVTMLNFAKPKTDALRFFGYLDVNKVPVLVEGVTGSLTIGDTSYSYTLGADGTFTSDITKTPLVRFIINRTNGAFALNVSLENLQDTFAAFGALNDNVPKPGKELAIPFSFTFHNLSLDSTLHPLYLATAGKSGRIGYGFPNTGFQDSGFLRIFTAQAAESGDGDKPRVHTFTVLGQMGLGGGQTLLKAATGNWRVTFGNYVEDIPVSALLEANGRYTYKAPKGKNGISQFIYDSVIEQWGVSYRNLQADGTDPSGMALSSSTVLRADMALSLDLDLANDGLPKYQASTYVRFARPKADKKKWKLR